MMNERGKSDNPILPEKLPNKAETAAEAMEERGLAKGNRSERNALRTQGRAGVQSALGRIRQATQRDGRQQFTALYHHVYNLDMLREGYFALKRAAAAGVDGVTWQQYRREAGGEPKESFRSAQARRIPSPAVETIACAQERRPQTSHRGIGPGG